MSDIVKTFQDCQKISAGVMLMTMYQQQIYLDQGNQHYLEFSQQSEGWLVRLCYLTGDRRSPLLAGYQHNLQLRVADQCYRFSPDQILLPDQSEIVSVLLGDTIELVRLRLAASIELLSEPYRLSPFESRFLAQNGFPHPVDLNRSTAEKLITDLHSHFAGCVSATQLIAMAAQHQVNYSVDLLQQAGIHSEKDQPVSALSPQLQQLLARQLEVPIDRRITFAGMEKIYCLRAPITKQPDLFIPICYQLARDYQAMGVKYVELSLSNIVEAARLRLVHQQLPAIEAETGVQIRFLAAMSRHDDPEWALDYLEQLKRVAGSRYIAGVDFMGHETNSTHAFADQLAALARWADRARPGFAIRVHAGENPAHPENIRVALDLISGGNLQLRIGHGLYGADDETIRALKEAGVIVEFNLNSNLALNNIQTAREVPIRRYLEAGVPVVLGSDGYGIYQTSLALELRAALIAGLSDRDLAALQATERRYLAMRTACDQNITSAASDFVIPDDLPHYYFTADVSTRVAAARQARDQALQSRLAALEIPLLDDQQVKQLLSERQVISIAGAWAKSWAQLSNADQEKIVSELAKLLGGLPLDRTVLITGGTHAGVENIVQEIARRRGFIVLGTLVKETPPDSLQADAITHACLVGEQLYDKAAGLYQLLKENNGICLFIGGGNIVSDEIQTAINLRLRYLLMTGIAGASALHAEQQPGHAFETAEQALALLQSLTPWHSDDEPYWHLGANPTVDIVLMRRQPISDQLEVLLIQRDEDAASEPGKWALPGGFQHTDAPRGTVWQPGHETAQQACLRELREEASLDLSELVAELIYVGDFEGEGRDPRDTETAWSRSQVFALLLPARLAESTIAGADDARDAQWWPIDRLPALAFDHSRILRAGLNKLRAVGQL